MGAGSVRRAVAVVAALAPALAWYATPAHALLAVAVGSLAIAAALHGLGRVVGRLVDDPDAPIALTITWGLTAYLGIAGLAIAIGGFDLRVQRVVLVASTAYGAAWWASRAARASWPVRPRLDAMTVVIGLAIAVAALHTLGAASTWTGAFFDGDGFLLGPLERLATTGTLGDGVALPRATGLGGNVIVTSLTAGFGDWRMVHGIDRGLGLALVFALAIGGSERTTARPFVAVIIIALVSATPEYPIDLAPRWTVVAIVFALLQTWRRAAATPRVGLAAVLLAAGLATVAHGGLGMVVVAVAAVIGAAERGPARIRIARTAYGLVALMLVGYVIAAVASARAEPTAPIAIASLHRGLIGRVLTWGLAGGFVYALASLVIRSRSDRALALTVAAIAAATLAAGLLSPTVTSGWTLVQPLGIALILIVVEIGLTDPERAAGLTPAAVTVAVLLALTLATTRFPTGIPPVSWEDRLGRMLESARAHATQPLADDSREAAMYRAAQDAIPPGARVGLWVDRADLVDYRRHHVVDLHSADADACAAIPAMQWWRRGPRACRAMRTLLRRLPLDYLLIARSALPRDDSWAVQPLCLAWRHRVCTDPLNPLVRRGRVVETRSDLAVIDLTALDAVSR